jgi:tRNA(guanine-26,N2-N2) methyltransferase
VSGEPRGVTEGRAQQVRADGAFLSSGGRVQRDLTVAAINAFAALDGAAPDSLVVLDALSASGLRALRIGLEVPSCKLVLCNDKSEAAHTCLLANIETHRQALASASVEVECSCLDASEAMFTFAAVHRIIDVIDIDPFGSPMHAIPAALACIRPGGLLSVAFFDLHVLCGSGGSGSAAACFARYGATPFSNMRCSHEIAVRIALASISKAAGCVGRSVETLMCAHMQSCVRIIVRVKGVESCGAASGDVGSSAVPAARPPLLWLWKCCRCAAGWLLQEASPVAGQVHVKGRCCEVCGAVGDMALGGPIYGGALSDSAFLDACAQEVQAGIAAGTIEQDSLSLKTVLSELKAELPLPLYHHLPSLTDALGIAPRLNRLNRSSVLAALSRRGFRVSHSHAAVHLGLKTDAPLRVLCDIVRAGAGHACLQQDAGLGGATRKRQREDHLDGTAHDGAGDDEGSGTCSPSSSVRPRAAPCSADGRGPGGAETRLVGAAPLEYGAGCLQCVCRQDLAKLVHSDVRMRASGAGAAAPAASAEGGATPQQPAPAPPATLNRRQRRLLKFAAVDSQRLPVGDDEEEGGGGAGVVALGEALVAREARGRERREGVLYVGEGEEFQEVGAAVAVAAAGALIRVRPGRYTCHLKLCRSVTIVGCGGRDPGGGGSPRRPGGGCGEVVLVGRGKQAVVTVNTCGDALGGVKFVGCTLTHQKSEAGGGGGGGGLQGEAEGAEGAGRRQVPGGKSRLALHTVTVNAGLLDLSECRVEGEGSATALMVCGTGMLALRSSTVTGPRGAGVCVCGKGEVLLVESEVSGALGPGLEVRGCGRLVAEECVVSECGKAGVFAHHNAAVELRRCRLSANAFAGEHSRLHT